MGGQKVSPPSDRIGLGFIGVRNQGTALLKAFFTQKELADVVAICDVDSAVLDDAKRLVDKQTGRLPAAYHDYRKLLDDSNVDAVVIATPDHWHALPTIDTCHAGKDVFCEKPLSLTIAEGKPWSRPRGKTKGSYKPAASSAPTTASGWPASWCARAESAKFTPSAWGSPR